MTWTDFWPLDLTFTTGHGWWLDPLRASVGQGAEYWPPRAIRDLICPLRWLSLVNLTLYRLCHTELFLLTMNYKTVRIYSLLQSERWFSFILNLIVTVIVRVRRLLGLLLTKSMNCSSFKATSHPDRNIWIWLFPSRCVHIPILLNCAMFTQQTNNGCKLLQLVN